MATTVRITEGDQLILACDVAEIANHNEFILGLVSDAQANGGHAEKNDDEGCLVTCNITSEKTETVSFHRSNLGSFGENLPCDMNGFVHMTAAAWKEAPVDMPRADRDDEDYMDEWSEEMAEKTREAVAAAEAGLADWQAGN